jgi:hypothetical protein
MDQSRLPTLSANAATHSERTPEIGSVLAGVVDCLNDKFILREKKMRG